MVRTRELLIDVARQLFARQGVAATTMNEKILKIQSDFATNMEKLLKKQEEQNNNEIESLKQDFKEHHSEYAKQILERVIKV